jgi:hypothetical protein
MLLKFSRQIDDGLIKGMKTSHVTGLVISPYDYRHATHIRAINSRSDMISQFMLSLPTEDLGRLGEELILLSRPMPLMTQR